MTRSSVTDPVEPTVCSEPQASSVDLLYVCDFPPSNLRGGTVLISRLLKGYPRLRVVTGSHYDGMAPAEGRLDCPHTVFPASDGTGRWGLGRLKAALDWFGLPFLAAKLVRLIRKERIQVIITIADGHFFLAAALAARASGTPYVLVVHDDWVATLRRSSYLLGHVAEPLFGAVLRRAAHVYAVSPAMQQVFQDEYEVQADLQLPAIAPPLHDRHRQEENQGEKTSPQFEIVYAGTSTSAVAVPLQMLVDVVRSGKLEKQGIDARFTLYTLPPDEEWKRAHGWDHPAINVQGWLSQAELPRALQHADVLFLPFSFEETEKPWVSQSFPSKTADYVAAGRPILVFGPPYSSIVRYASQTGCAEIVQTPDPDALAGAIARIANSPACREQLRARSLQIFRKNHDILRQRAQLHATLERVAHAGRTGTQNVTMSPCKDQEAIPSSLLVKEKE